MSEINSPEELKKMLGSRIKKLTKSDENLHSLGIKEDTLSKYYKGQRFPTTENLVKIQKRYKVPYAYLFGDTDNDNPNFAEISCKLGLTKKSIEKLLTINKTENQEEKNIQLFALNQLIEKIDFLELGKFMFVPDEREKDYYDFLINKKIITLINEIRNSEECAKG